MSKTQCDKDWQRFAKHVSFESHLQESGNRHLSRGT